MQAILIPDLKTRHDGYRPERPRNGEYQGKAPSTIYSLKNLPRNHALGMANLNSWVPESSAMYTQQDFKQAAYPVYPVTWTCQAWNFYPKWIMFRMPLPFTTSAEQRPPHSASFYSNIPPLKSFPNVLGRMKVFLLCFLSPLLTFPLRFQPY